MRSGFPAAALCAAMLVAALGCGKEDPVFHSDIGVTAVPVDAGALEGVFALFFLTSQIIDAPLIGKNEGGGEEWYLVTRTWDGTSYTEVHDTCGGVIFEVAGTETDIPNSARRRAPPSTTHTLDIRDDAGVYAVQGVLELWGITDLPDLYETALPDNKRDAADAPHVDRIVDTDQDGEAGMTAHVRGIASGDQYFVQRRITHLDGITLGPDRLIGLQAHTLERTVIGGTTLLLESQTTVEADPNPLLNWFDQVRLDPDADCDDVQAVVDGGSLGERPF